MFLSAVVPAAFFTSGAAGLIFQLIWFYRCGLVLGSSVASVTAVLTAFMSGLAVGNALTTRYAPRLTDYFRAYVVLEVIVAASGLLASALLPRLTVVIVPFTEVISSSTGINLVRFLLAFGLMVIPAAAMGATLPVLVAGVQHGFPSAKQRPVGVSLGLLYGWNTFGAVTGVLVSEFVLVSRVGISGSALVAAALNLAAAALVGGLRRVPGDMPDGTSVDERFGRGRGSGPDDGARHQPGVRRHSRRESLILLATALSGAILLGLEVTWFRFLSMYVLVTTAAMSVMLAVVLAGIAAGGLFAALWLRRRRVVELAIRPMTVVATLACVAGALASGGYRVFTLITSGTQVESLGSVLWFALVLTLPVSFCSGILFTTLGDALHGPDGDTGAVTARDTSRFVLANTSGAILGPPMAGYVLLPWLGLERAFFTLAVGYGLVAGLALFADRLSVARAPHAARRRQWLPAGATVVLLTMLATFPFGAMATSYLPRVAAAYNSDGSLMVASSEGPSETIVLMQQRWLGRPVYSRLVTNGFSMSGTALQGQRYMRAFAYYPMLFHEGAIEDALVICYGVGVTVSAVTHNPAVKKIDVAEISRDVVSMSDAIYPEGARPLEDPRVRVHIEDGRFFLQTTSARYDLITGEPPPPRTPGATNIYTEEFFRLVHSRLRDHGIASYWVPVARPNPGTDVNTIIKAFCNVFADCTLWNATPFDLMLVGSRGGSRTTRTMREFTAPWQTPGLESRLREVGFERAEQIGATFVGDAVYLNALTKDTPPLTDDFPHRLNPAADRTSLSDPRYGHDADVARMYQEALDVSRAQSAFASSSWVRTVWPPELIERTQPFFRQQSVLNRVYWEGSRPLHQIDDLDAVLTDTSLRTLPLWILGSDEVKQRIAEAPAPEQGADGEPGSREYARALRAVSGRDFAGAAQWLSAAEQRGFPASTLIPLRAYALTRGGRSEEARALAASNLSASGDAAQFWTWLRRALAD